MRHRWSLDFPDWPTPDQQAWTLALKPAALFKKGGLASSWAAATRVTVAQSYGQWLHFLHRHGGIEAGSTPGNRVTEGRLQAYHIELTKRLSSMAVASALRNLGEAIRVMDPHADRRLLTAAVKSAEKQARPERDERCKLVSPTGFFKAAKARMERFRAATDGMGALCFSDGLMMGVLVCKPIRKKNLAAMEIGRNLKKASPEQYRIVFEAAATKTGRRRADRSRIDAMLSSELTEYIDDWLTKLRPVLATATSGAALWPGRDGRALTMAQIDSRFCCATLQELGKEINPHFVRTIVRTGLATGAPDQVELARYSLDHTRRDVPTAQEAYDLADNYTASIRYLEILQKRRS